jgi:hypothetical protein
VVSGVQEEHVDTGQRRPDEVRHGRVLHRRGDGQAVAEHRDRPAHDLLGRSELQLASCALGEGLQVDVDGGKAGHDKLPRGVGDVAALEVSTGEIPINRTANTRRHETHNHAPWLSSCGRRSSSAQ